MLEAAPWCRLILIVMGDSYILKMHWSSAGCAAWSHLSLMFNTKLIRTVSLRWSKTLNSVCVSELEASAAGCYTPGKHTDTMKTCDWQQSSIRRLPCTRASRETFTESYQSATRWHAYFRLLFLLPFLPLLLLFRVFFLHISLSLSVWGMTSYLPVQ